MVFFFQGSEHIDPRRKRDSERDWGRKARKIAPPSVPYFGNTTTHERHPDTCKGRAPLKSGGDGQIAEKKKKEGGGKNWLGNRDALPVRNVLLGGGPGADV